MIKRNSIYVVVLLTTIMLVVVFITTGKDNIYGSMTDWVMQHTVISDYFRTLFYDTGELLPNFALHIGAGQNIYYFSYYGLLNPIILFSYFLPFIQMIDYLMIVNILSIIISAFLVYKWLGNNKVDFKIALVCSIIFLLMNSFFHAHRHMMFINYMPFLISGLIGIDKYFSNGGKTLYAISVFLIIMSSYYYSVGALFCLFIYGIYKYIENNRKINIKIFIIDMVKFLMPMFIGVMMSMVLLIPTAFVILSSRSHIDEITTLVDLFIPHFNFNALLYDNYGMGLTAIAFISFIYVLLHSKGAKRFLSSSLFLMLIIPVFMFVLNGMLYLRSKVFIPLSPLILIFIVTFLSDLKDNKVNKINYIIIVIISLCIAIIFKYYEIPFYLDTIITSSFVILYLLKKNSAFIYTPLIIIALFSNVIINTNDNYVSKETYNEIKSSNINKHLNNIYENDPTFYRINNLISVTSLNVNRVYNANYYHTSIYSSTYNSYYKDFYDNIFNNAIPFRNKLMTSSSNNIMFQTLMNVKYIISSVTDIPIGYNLLVYDDNIGLYKNDNVFPLGFSTSSLMSVNDFNKLDYPYREEALLNYIIVNKDVKSNYITNINSEKLIYDYIGEINYKLINNKYLIDAEEEETVRLKLKEPIDNQILFIRFKLNKAPDCQNGDIYFSINDITNNLTCKQWLYFNDNYEFEYVVSNPDPIDELKIVISKGHFEIDNIEIFKLNYDYVKDRVAQLDKFVVDKNKTKGNVVEGQIRVTKDGYFMLTIPYDEGFSIYVNDKKIKYELVDNAFIGFPISKGTHDIKLVYKAPGYNLGIICSLLGVMLFISLFKIKSK